jgi:hypothetical protein
MLISIEIMFQLGRSVQPDRVASYSSPGGARMTSNFLPARVTVPTVIAFHIGRHRDTISNPNHMIC